MLFRPNDKSVGDKNLEESTMKTDLDEDIDQPAQTSGTVDWTPQEERRALRR